MELGIPLAGPERDKAHRGLRDANEMHALRNTALSPDWPITGPHKHHVRVMNGQWEAGIIMQLD